MVARTEKEDTRLLTNTHVEELRRSGWVLLRGGVPPEEIDNYSPAIRDYIMGTRQGMNADEQAMGASATKTFFRLDEAPQAVSDFVTSPLLGEIAARLLGVEAVRVLHFCGFFKASGGPSTPWHQDLTYIPLDTDKALSIWIPLMDMTPEMGALVFAEGSHLSGALDNPFAARERFPLAQTGNLKVGDVSVHMGWTVHASLKNTSARMREAFSVCYYADGARIRLRGDVPFMRSLMDSYFAGLSPGDVAAGPRNPVVYRAAQHVNDESGETGAKKKS